MMSQYLKNEIFAIPWVGDSEHPIELSSKSCLNGLNSGLSLCCQILRAPRIILTDALYQGVMVLSNCLILGNGDFPLDDVIQVISQPSIM